MFEYMVLNSINSECYEISVLNRLGKQGWGLVAIHPAKENIGYLFYFKRHLSDKSSGRDNASEDPEMEGLSDTIYSLIPRNSEVDRQLDRI